jgi:hypothetical protein
MTPHLAFWLGAAAGGTFMAITVIGWRCTKGSHRAGCCARPSTASTSPCPRVESAHCSSHQRPPRNRRPPFLPSSLSALT